MSRVGVSEQDYNKGVDTSGDHPLQTLTACQGCYTVHLACVCLDACIRWVIKRSALR